MSYLMRAREGWREGAHKWRLIRKRTKIQLFSIWHSLSARYKNLNMIPNFIPSLLDNIIQEGRGEERAHKRRWIREMTKIML